MTDRRAVSACVLCAFALAPAASAFAQGGAAAPSTISPVPADPVTSAAPLAQTAEQRAALQAPATGAATAPQSVTRSDAPARQAATAPDPRAGEAAAATASAPASAPAASSAAPATASTAPSAPAVLRTAPRLRPVQNAGDTVEVPVPRAAAAPAAAATPKLPMTGLDLGLLFSLGLALIGSGLVVRGVAEPRDRVAQPRGRNVTV